MKKIKFGSFPLISMPRKDRDCIDKYCIKNYADLITLNSAVKGLSDTSDKYDRERHALQRPNPVVAHDEIADFQQGLRVLRRLAHPTGPSPK